MKKRIFLVIAACLVGLWFRIPSISEGLPYFYNEDEAHHFNRVVNMVKSGDLNPHYFHKPSLHFYLRIPVVAASFLWGVKKGHLRSVKEIKTQDPFGLGGYAFTVSHPGVVKWNRAFTVLLGLLTIALTFFITRDLVSRNGPAFAAALLVAVSPEMIRYGAVIGVDILMTLLCVFATFLSLRVYRNYSLSGLLCVGIVAGLAVSSKYNAIPIALLPLSIILLLRQFGVRDIAIALLAPVAGFFVATPYALTSIPLFLDQVAYEVWHYKIAGHVGHTGEPGLSQALFYTKWIARDALGYLALFLCVVALVFILIRRRAEYVLFAVFPALFFLLMIEQRANFTRNMLVILPYVAIFAVIGARELMRNRASITSPLIFAACLQPFLLSFGIRSSQQAPVESRRTLESLLQESRPPYSDIAIAGQLQLPSSVFRIPGAGGINQDTESGLSLSMKGYDLVVVNSLGLTNPQGASLLEEVKKIDGVSGKQRIVENPEIHIYRINDKDLPREELLHYLNTEGDANVEFRAAGDSFRCSSG